MTASQSAQQTMQAALNANAAGGMSRKLPADLKAKTFDGLPDLTAHRQRGFLRKLRAMADWEEDAERAVFISYPSDAKAYWESVIGLAETAFEQAITEATRRRGVQTSSLAYVTEGFEIATFTELVPKWKPPNDPIRDEFLETQVSASLLTALPSDIVERCKTWVGKHPQSVALLYVYRLELYKDTGTQRTAVEKEFAEFGQEAGESIPDAWIRFRPALPASP